MTIIYYILRKKMMPKWGQREARRKRWTNRKVHGPGSTRVFFRRRRDWSHSVLLAETGTRTPYNRIRTTSHPAGNRKSWAEKELALRGVNWCIGLVYYCPRNGRALTRRSLAEDEGWGRRLAPGGSGASQLKFDGHLRCTG